MMPVPAIARLPRRAGVNTFPTSFAQERLWVLEQAAPGHAAASVAGAFRVNGGFDRGALRRSLEAVVARHESLRTTFAAIDGVPLQVVSPYAAVGMRIVDLRERDEDDADRRLARAHSEVRREVERPFDVAHGPLLRFTSFRVADDTELCCIALHHLIADAWSMPVLVRELSVLYRAFVGGHAAELPAVPLQYADYAHWQRQCCERGAAAAAAAYWRQQLEGAPYPRVQSGGRLVAGHAAASRPLAAELVQAVRALARRERTTWFVTALAAWQAVLARWNGCDDVTVLSPFANRDRSETADLIGFFVNVVALRTRVDGDPRFRGLLLRVQRVVRDAQRHQQLPFERLLTELGIERNWTRPPLSPIGFALEQLAAEPIVLSDAAIVPIELDRPTSRMDLALVLRQHATGVTARLEYDRGVLAAAVAEPLLNDFVAVLERAVADPERRLSELGATTTPTGARTAASLAGETVWDRFAAQAAATPEAVAIHTDTALVTYRRLAARAAAVAHVLAARGVQPDTLVAVWGERGARLIGAMLGIFRAGAAYLPLDPRWPAARLAQVLRQSGTRIVLIGGETPAALHPVTTSDATPTWELLPVDDDDGSAEAAPTCGVRPPQPTDLAYVIYTSGSTGTPKGAMIEHAGLLNHLESKRTLLRLTADDRVAQTAAAGFDISVWQCLAVLLAGGRVEVISDPAARDPSRLRAAVAELGVTVLEVVPALLRAMLDLEDERSERGSLARLRWLVVTGEPLTPQLCRDWLRHYPHIPLVNAYGPTECADDVTHHVVTAPPAPIELRVPIGLPIANLAVHVLDDGLTPVADGTVGELCVSGVGVGRGYWRDPVRTAAAFVPSPFAHCPETRLYRTGDVGRRRADGTFECLGRLDHQVKIRGTRVEPGEIEAVLRQHPTVRDAAVVARSDRGADQRLVAYVTASSTTSASPATLRQFVAERLPAPMVPSTFVTLAALPVDGNGKLDRRGLALLAPHTADASRVRRRPDNEIERTLCDIWSAVLDVEAPSVDDSFFALGGDSLSSIQVVARAQRHGIVLRPQDLFEHQTIARLAAVATTAAAPRAEQSLVVGDVPLTPIQRLFFAAELAEAHHYNLAVLLAVPGPLDASLMAIGVERLLRHHDALRLRFRRDESGWRQRSAGLDGVVPFTTVDLSATPDAELPAAIAAVADRAHASLDLAEGPIVRVVHLNRGPRRPGRLLVVVHHLACDVVSWPFLLEDLHRVYDQLEHGDAIAFPEKTSAFRAWAECLREYARRPERACDLRFWEWECADAGARLPLAGPAHAPAAADLEHVRVTVGRHEAAALGALAVTAGASVEGVLLTALATALTATTGGTALLVYLERHGREALFPELDVSRTVGWFTAVFPVCLRVAASRRPMDTLAAIVRHLHEIPDGGVGFTALRAGLHDAAAAAVMRALPQPETSFNYLGRTDPPADASWTASPEPVGRAVGVRGTRPTVLDVTAHVAGGELHVEWAYDATLLRRATITDFAERFVAVLGDLADEAGRASSVDDPQRKAAAS